MKTIVEQYCKQNPEVLSSYRAPAVVPWMSIDIVENFLCIPLITEIKHNDARQYSLLAYMNHNYLWLRHIELGKQDSLWEAQRSMILCIKPQNVLLNVKKNVKDHFNLPN